MFRQKFSITLVLNSKAKPLWAISLDAASLHSVTLPRACACAAWYDWWTDAGMPGIDGREIGVCLVVLGGEADCGALGDALGASGVAAAAAAAAPTCGGGGGT